MTLGGFRTPWFYPFVLDEDEGLGVRWVGPGVGCRETIVMGVALFSSFFLGLMLSAWFGEPVMHVWWAASTIIIAWYFRGPVWAVIVLIGVAATWWFVLRPG